MRSPARACRCVCGPRRGRAGHDPLPHRRASGLLGALRTRGQRVRREEEGPRLHRARQPLPGPGPRRGRGRAAKTDTFLGERYRRIARRRGTKKAIVAVGRSILVIIWHLLSDPEARYHDLGSDFYDQPRSTPNASKRNHIHQLEALGYKVTLEPAA